MADAVVVDAIAGSAPYVMWGTLTLFNVATIKLLQMSLSGIDLQQALTEKAPQGKGATSTSTTTIDSDPTNPAAPTTTKEEEVTEPGRVTDDPSYSRIAGMIGAVVMAAFLWGLGNILIYKSFAAPTEVAGLLQNVGGFFLAGAALFAPYAANKLTTAFKGS